MDKTETLLYQLCKTVLDYSYYDCSGDYDESMGEQILTKACVYTWYLEHREFLAQEEEKKRQKILKKLTSEERKILGV